MPSTEVQRTLVKSPPELWTELSDPQSLARHLGELGEIRVTRVEPESTVEWEAENVRGSVQLKPSGWGTKVTFAVTRDLPEPAVEDELEPEMSEPALVEPGLTEPEAAEPELAGAELAEPEPMEPEPAEPEPAEPAAEPAPTSRRGFFARLFRRRRAEVLAPQQALDPEPTPQDAQAPTPEPTPQGTQAATPEPTIEPAQAPGPEAATEHAEPPAENRPDLAAELEAMEATIVEQDTALLSAVLDRLGAAHHRPFSRG
ncbi:MAG TPA: hypothetical protein VGI76_09910 [Solirubrobacteraceae bacterium]